MDTIATARRKRSEDKCGVVGQGSFTSPNAFHLTGGRVCDGAVEGLATKLTTSILLCPSSRSTQSTFETLENTLGLCLWPQRKKGKKNTLGFPTRSPLHVSIGKLKYQTITNQETYINLKQCSNHVWYSTISVSEQGRPVELVSNLCSTQISKHNSYAECRWRTKIAQFGPLPPYQQVKTPADVVQTFTPECINEMHLVLLIALPSSWKRRGIAPIIFV